ncbi:hypothetical protein E2C01_045105 [Portunus trituberculatus]|uniref:Uncharacterized protein n=1 Tax=Portunus trituberculatus TaxID=210409 RepID=A0A5B7FU09_PORTR|nr:hypothetical protein [Portunus trituberculatus]
MLPKRTTTAITHYSISQVPGALVTGTCRVAGAAVVVTLLSGTLTRPPRGYRDLLQVDLDTGVGVVVRVKDGLKPWWSGCLRNEGGAARGRKGVKRWEVAGPRPSPAQPSPAKRNSTQLN